MEIINNYDFRNGHIFLVKINISTELCTCYFYAGDSVLLTFLHDIAMKIFICHQYTNIC